MHAATGSKSPSGSSPDRLRYNCALVHGAREEVAFSDADILHPAHLTTCPGTCPHRSSIIRSPVRKKRCLRLDLVLSECPRLTGASVHSIIQLCNNQRRRYVDIDYRTDGSKITTSPTPIREALHENIAWACRCRARIAARASLSLRVPACLLALPLSTCVVCPELLPVRALATPPHCSRFSVGQISLSLPLWSGRYAYADMLALVDVCGNPQIV